MVVGALLLIAERACAYTEMGAECVEPAYMVMLVFLLFVAGALIIFAFSTFFVSAVGMLAALFSPMMEIYEPRMTQRESLRAIAPWFGAFVFLGFGFAQGLDYGVRNLVVAATTFPLLVLIPRAGALRGMYIWVAVIIILVYQRMCWGNSVDWFPIALCLAFYAFYMFLMERTGRGAHEKRD